MPSRDVNAATRLAEGSWRCDKKLNEASKEGKRANDSPLRVSELQHKWHMDTAIYGTAITDNHETDPREKGRDP